MRRREFLKRGLAITGAALSGIALTDVSTSAAPAGAPAPLRLPRTALPRLNQLTGHVILRGDSDYEEARAERNSNASSSPAVVVFCRDAQDVVHAVTWAREQGIPLRIRCGRHSYEGYSSVDDGLVIDIHDLRRVRYDRARGTVRMGAGFSLAKVYEALWQHRVTIPGGSCPTVGISGHALGGGYGLLARRLGMACDSTLEVQIVTADGKILRANSDNHPDLLWASRGGGGGNFGVVTEFVFKVHPIDTVSIFHLTWRWSDLDAVLDAWQTWAPNIDDRLTSVLVLKSVADGTLSAMGQFSGSGDGLRGLLAPLYAVATPLESSLQTLSFMDAVQTFSGQKPSPGRWQLHWTAENSHFKHSSDYADRTLSKDAMAILRHSLETAPGNSCFVQLEAYGGAIDRVPRDATAFVHRSGTLFNLQYQSYWGRTQDGGPYIAWVEELRRAMQPFVSGRAYSNYCDSAIADWPHAYYGENLARLIDVKKKYDPHDLFHFPQSIPLNA